MAMWDARPVIDFAWKQLAAGQGVAPYFQALFACLMEAGFIPTEAIGKDNIVTGIAWTCYNTGNAPQTTHALTPQEQYAIFYLIHYFYRKYTQNYRHQSSSSIYIILEPYPIAWLTPKTKQSRKQPIFQMSFEQGWEILNQPVEQECPPRWAIYQPPKTPANPSEHASVPQELIGNQ